MAFFYRRFLLLFVLLLALAGRVSTYAMPFQKISQEFFHVDIEQNSESSENPNPSEEKSKMSDFLFADLYNFGFVDDNGNKSHFLSPNFNLMHSYLQTPEQPPK
ncbi:hypothetical protein [Sphingobacterium hungaricum]|uniref:Uncharacterized protein n=1 Tax=Sphingobacterium hungaricum TaxID=2082723 RepID=A0A928UXA8_9SPHI|nr:hypothetical protein [Sphingobacterium hungaricum]MBE8714713.1 hypothetical protein [Sphingobacterium hungaricum]